MTFDDTVFKRWCNDVMLCCQPMTDYVVTYRGMIFEAKDGYWWFNGERFGLLKDVRQAMVAYDEEINRLLAKVADS
jgi:hypothetical protein